MTSGSRTRYEIDLATTQAGTPGGIFMRQFWMAVYESDQLPAGRAMPIRIMGQDYVIFRTQSGVAQVMAQRCPHRGAQMHLGWVQGEELRCVYHGWKFDCTGRCTEQPAEEPGYNEKVRIKTYPTGEHMGLIFAYFGDGEAPQFPPFPEPDGEGVIEVRPSTHVPCNYLQCFENSMDEVHVAFTHAPGGSHTKIAQDLPIITAEETPWGMMRYGTRKDGQVRHTLHYAPNAVRVFVPPFSGMDGIGGWPEIMLIFTPVDDENCRWFATSKVYVTGEEADRYWTKRRQMEAEVINARPIMDVVHDIWSGKLIYEDVRHPQLARVQDIAVQAGQGRIADRENEFLGRSDAGIVTWRRILQRELRAIANGVERKKWATPPADVKPVMGA
jgi:5,5'-dehydrodivanillate O-demethylase oxygenase subunit